MIELLFIVLLLSVLKIRRQYLISMIRFLYP